MARKTECSKKKMKISVKRRLKLIDMVEHQNMSVVRASKKLELKVCTARSILSKYKKKGIIYDKKQKKHIVAPLPPSPSSPVQPPSEKIVIKQEPMPSPPSRLQDQPQFPPLPLSLPPPPFAFPTAPTIVQNPNMLYFFYYF